MWGHRGRPHLLAPTTPPTDTFSPRRPRNKKFCSDGEGWSQRRCLTTPTVGALSAGTWPLRAPPTCRPCFRVTTMTTDSCSLSSTLLREPLEPQQLPALCVSTPSRVVRDRNSTAKLQVLFVTEQDPLYVICFFDTFFAEYRATNSRFAESLSTEPSTSRSGRLCAACRLSTGCGASCVRVRVSYKPDCAVVRLKRSLGGWECQSYPPAR